MTNELRAIADKFNENKRREHAEAVKQFVEKHILPELKSGLWLGTTATLSSVTALLRCRKFWNVWKVSV